MTDERMKDYVLGRIAKNPGCTPGDIGSYKLTVEEVRSIISEAITAGEVMNTSDTGESYEITDKGDEFLRVYAAKCLEKLAESMGMGVDIDEPNQSGRMRSSFIYRPRVADALLYIRDNPDCLKGDVYKVMGGNGKSIDNRINSLVENGLVVCTKGTEGRDIYMKLTNLGSDITDHIQTIESLMSFVGVM